MFFKKVLDDQPKKSVSMRYTRLGVLISVFAVILFASAGFVRLNSAHANASAITIDKDVQYEQIEGFGSFGANDNDAQNDTRFNDLGATVVRVGIDPSFEPSDGNYNLDTIPSDPCQGGSRPIDEFNRMKAMKQKADAQGIDVKFIGSVWSPPGWMKHNNCILGNNSAINRIINTPENLAKYADFMVQWVKAVKDNTGIDMYAVSLQNEPGLALTYASTYYTPEDFRDTLKVVGPALRQNYPDLKIFFPEEVSRPGHIAAYVEAVQADPAARPYIDALAVHGYGGDGIQPAGGQEFWTQVYQLGARYNLPIWMTETSGYNSTWGDAIKLAGAIHQSLVYGNLSMWVYWTTACPSNYNENEALLNCDYTITPKAAASAQYYKYIRPGAVRVDATSSDSDVLVSAFTNRNDNSTSVVLINQNLDSSKDVTFSFNGSNYPGSYSIVRSSASENAVTVGTYTPGSTLTIPASSVVTLTGTTSQQDPTTGPGIVEQPQNVTVSPGSQTTLSVQATGTPRLTYQWKRNGVNIDNAIGPLYTFMPTSADDGATYSVTITNAYGSVTSDTVTVTLGAFDGASIPQATGPIETDGYMTEADWATAPTYQITHALNNPVGLSASFQSLWDSSNLYFLVRVNDADFANNTDSIEIYLDGSNEKKLYYDGHTWQFVFNQKDYSALVYHGGTQTNPPAFATYGQSRDSSGFTIEIGIPWSNLGIIPTAGTLVGLDIDIAQSIPDAGTHKIFWHNTKDTNWSTPADFGTAQLIAA